jgi:hypothetical protein
VTSVCRTPASTEAKKLVSSSPMAVIWRKFMAAEELWTRPKKHCRMARKKNNKGANQSQMLQFKVPLTDQLTGDVYNAF